MQYIVTGGAGFIGSNLTLALQDSSPGSALTVVDDFSSGDFHNLIGFRGDVIAQPCEQLDWERCFGRAEVRCIYHLASITDTTVTDQREMIERNVESFRRVLDFAQSRGVKVVYASSAATYGLNGGPMREDQPSAPGNVYGFSKSVLDNLAMAANREGLDVAGVRYFNVFGPHEQHKGKMASMIYRLYSQMSAGQRPQIFHDGTQQRDHVYVKDVVAATLLAGEPGRQGVFNVGAGKSVSFLHLVDVLNRCLGTQLEPEFTENPYRGAYQSFTQADLELAHSELGYQPQWEFDAAVADYCAWLGSQPGGAG